MAGYEDLNDHDVLHKDEGFRLALGSNIASCPTLCRFERQIIEKTIDKGNEFLRDFYLKHGSRKKLSLSMLTTLQLKPLVFKRSSTLTATTIASAI